LAERWKVNEARRAEHKREREELIRRGEEEPSFYDPDPEFWLPNRLSSGLSEETTREKRLSRMRIRRESIGEESGDCCGDGEGIFEMDEEEPKWVRELKMKELCMVEGWKGRVKRGLFKVFGRKWKVGERVEKDFEIVFEEDDGDEDDEEETRMACAWDEIFGEVDLESDRWTLP